jgi:hypothetical protein
LEAVLPHLAAPEETGPWAGNSALLLGGLATLTAGVMVSIWGGFFVWIDMLGLYGVYGLLSNSKDFAFGLLIFALLGRLPLAAGLPLIVLGWWLMVVRRRRSPSGQGAPPRRLNGHAVGALAVAAMTPTLGPLPGLLSVYLAVRALRELRFRVQHYRGAWIAWLAIVLAVGGSGFFLWQAVRAAYVYQAYAASDRAAQEVADGRLELAVADATQALTRFPRLAAAWKTRGAAHLQQGLPQAAADDLSQAIAYYSLSVQPTNQNPLFATVRDLAECHRLRAQAYDALGRPAEALADRERVEALSNINTIKPPTSGNDPPAIPGS